MKIIFATIEEAPENIKDKLVKQEDGTYLYEGTGLVDKNKELLAEVKRLKGVEQLLKGLDTTQLTPEKIAAALKEHESKDQLEAQIQQRIEAAVAENSRKHQDRITASESTVTKMKTALESHLLDNQLTAAIAEEKGNSLFLAPVLRGRLKVVEKDGTYDVRVLNEKGEIDLDAEGKPVSVKALVQAVKKDEKFASVFTAPAGTGTGTTPGAGAGAGGGSAGASGLAPNAQGIVVIPRSQAKDPAIYRQALETVKGDFNKVQIEPAAAPVA